MFKNFLIFALSYGILLTPMGAYAGGIVADTGGPQVTINGPDAADLVNINKPTKGVSHNQYTQFDVSNNGVVLNNSTGGANTQLLGDIAGNANLAGGAAKLILNEINSVNPSQINGYIEVGGQRADVIVANPNGINVDGGGFLNVSTGTLQADNGRITVNATGAGGAWGPGDGLDAATNDVTNLIARDVQINAVAQGGKALNVAVTGDSQYAIDVSALGGLYAGSINLVGDATGVGVRNAGTIRGKTGGLAINLANGTLENSGDLDSAAGTYINAAKIDNQAGAVIQSYKDVALAAGEMNNAGHVVASGGLGIEVKGGLTNTKTGKIESFLGQTISAGTVNNSGHVVTSDALTVASKKGITNQGTLESFLGLGLLGDSINNSGHIVTSGAALLGAQSDISNQGFIESNKDLAIVSADGLISNSSGGRIVTSGDAYLEAEGDLENSGEIESGHNLTAVSVAGDLNNNGRIISSDQAGLLAEAGDVNNSGVVEAYNGLAIAAAGTLDNSGRIIGSGNVTLVGEEGLANSGQVESGLNFLASSANGGLDNQGSIVSSGDAGFLSRGDFTNEGVIESFFDLGVYTDSDLVNSGQLITSGNALFLAGKNFSNTAEGFISAGNHDRGHSVLVATGNNLSNAGTIETAGNFLAAADGNGQGAINNSGLIDSRGDAGFLSPKNFTNSGTITAVGPLSIYTGGVLNNLKGTLSTNDYGLLVADVYFANSGQVNTGEALTIATNGLLLNAGQIQSGGDLIASSSRDSIINSNGASIASQGDAGFISPRTFSNTGSVSADKTLTVYAESGITSKVPSASLHGAVVNLASKIYNLNDASQGNTF